jgi:hypothetical protein
LFDLLPLLEFCKTGTVLGGGGGGGGGGGNGSNGVGASIIGLFSQY